MRITTLGHAGLYIETGYGSVLCDPWFNPAFYASWFPFPANDSIDLTRISRPTYLYISHLHDDHFDAQFLQQHVSKEAMVLLPDFPLGSLERELRKLGFKHFIQTKNAEAIEVNGLRFMIMAMTAPNDGAIGDSGLVVNDGGTCIFDQNDSRPIDLDTLIRFGPFDAHFVQYSGATWFPVVYQFPEKMLAALGRKKRENQLARALRYAQELGAEFVIPSAGPPCFLDDRLFQYNDFDRDPTNTFPDQIVFLEYMQAHGLNNGRMMIPGSVATLGNHECIVEHPLPETQVAAIFTEKRAYLEAYKARKQPLINELKAAWPRNQVDILSSLREWFEPLLTQADLMCVGVNGRVLLDFDTYGVIIDFQLRKVYAWNGEEWDYRFHLDPALVEDCILQHHEDWLNKIFLSFRFEAQRKGPYNEYVSNFFLCLAPERIQYAEKFYAEKADIQQLWESDGYRIQRHCPHLKADLTRFGKIENGILTCALHGWQYELSTGRCLTSEGYRLFAQPISPDEANSRGLDDPELSEAIQVSEKAPFTRIKCNHCWYTPSELSRVSKQSE